MMSLDFTPPRHLVQFIQVGGIQDLRECASTAHHRESEHEGLCDGDQRVQPGEFPIAAVMKKISQPMECLLGLLAWHHSVVDNQFDFKLRMEPL